MKLNLNVSPYSNIPLAIFLFLSATILSTQAQDLVQTQKNKTSQIDTISLKQNQISSTTVMVATRYGRGSGIIIQKISFDSDKFYEYSVLTNAHVTRTRIIKQLVGADALTGKLKTRMMDTGCNIVVFEHDSGKWTPIRATVVAEDITYDLAILSFFSAETLCVAKIASKNLLSQVRVFDNIFATGCQLGDSPTPTSGIISRIITGKHQKKQWTIYGITSQITPGSSGGGLFKEYNHNYYLIGIPYRIAVASNGQLVPHLASAISIDTARDFINANTVIDP